MQLIPKNIRVYYLTEEHLETIATLNLTNSVYLGFFGICLGLLAAFGITLTTVEIRDAVPHAMFVALTFSSAILSLLLGIIFLVGFKRSREEIHRAKRTEPASIVMPTVPPVPKPDPSTLPPARASS